MTRNRCGKVIVIGIGEEERFPLRVRRSSIAPVGEPLLLRGNMFDDVKHKLEYRICLGFTRFPISTDITNDGKIARLITTSARRSCIR